MGKECTASPENHEFHGSLKYWCKTMLIIYSEEIDPSIIRSGNLSAKFGQTLENIPEEEGKDEKFQENIPEEEASRLLEWEVEWLERLKSAQMIYNRVSNRDGRKKKVKGPNRHHDIQSR